MWSTPLKIEVDDEGSFSPRKGNPGQNYSQSGKQIGVIGTPIGSMKKQTPTTGPMTNLSYNAG
jgi:hypothetical protein